MCGSHPPGALARTCTHKHTPKSAMMPWISKGMRSSRPGFLEGAEPAGTAGSSEGSASASLSCTN